MRAVGQSDGGAARARFPPWRRNGRDSPGRCRRVLLDRDAEQAKLAELRPQLARKRVGAIDLVGERRDLVLRETRAPVAQHVDVAAKTEIEAGQAVGNHRALQSGANIARFPGAAQHEAISAFTRVFDALSRNGALQTRDRPVAASCDPGSAAHHSCWPRPRTAASGCGGDAATCARGRASARAERDFVDCRARARLGEQKALHFVATGEPQQHPLLVRSRCLRRAPSCRAHGRG